MNGVIIPNKIDTGWVLLSTSVPPSNSAVYIKREGDRVTLRCDGWANVTTLTIPSEYRPSIITYVIACGNDGQSITMDRLSINTNGSMSLVTTSMIIGQVSYSL